MHGALEEGIEIHRKTFVLCTLARTKHVIQYNPVPRHLYHVQMRCQISMTKTMYTTRVKQTRTFSVQA